MSRDAKAPPEAEYVVNWRVAWAITGLTLVMIAVPVSSRLWLPHFAHRSVPRSPDVSPPPTRTVAKVATNRDETEIQVTAFTPWVTRKPSTTDRHREQPSIDEHVHASQSTQTSESHDSANVELEKETESPPVDSQRFDLHEDLRAHSVEISIDRISSAREDVIQRAYGENLGLNFKRSSPDGFLFNLIASRKDLEGIPLRRGTSCYKEASAIKVAGEISRALGSLGGNPRSRAQLSIGFEDSEAEMEWEMACVRELRFRTDAGDSRPSSWHQADAIVPLVQMLQTRSYVVRLELVKLIASIKGAKADKALVDRALFDFSPWVRTAAINALRARELDTEVRQQLVSGLRYPWAPVAEHAADTIIALQLREMIAELTRLLEEPAPDAPFVDTDGQWRKTELVGLNHLRNCVLCHAVSTAKTDQLRGLVPIPGEPLPLLYYESTKGDFVRADVTYLQQDFSVMQFVADADHWPETQRFDYFVRTRRMTPEEVSTTQEKTVSYPQREAVARAIRELSDP